MFGIGSGELLLIVVVAVLVLGPEHLPRIMRTTQTVMSTFRKITTEFQRTLNLEEVLKETDSRSTTKRQPTTTKKKKKKAADSPTTTKKKTAKKSTTKGTTKKTTQGSGSPAAPQPASTPGDPSATHEAPPHSDEQGATSTAHASQSAPAASQEPKPHNIEPQAAETPPVTAASAASADEEKGTYPRTTQYVKVTPQTQYGFDENPEPPADHTAQPDRTVTPDNSQTASDGNTDTATVTTKGADKRRANDATNDVTQDVAHSPSDTPETRTKAGGVSTPHAKTPTTGGDAS